MYQDRQAIETLRASSGFKKRTMFSHTWEMIVLFPWLLISKQCLSRTEVEYARLCFLGACVANCYANLALKHTGLGSFWEYSLHEISLSSERDLSLPRTCLRLRVANANICSLVSGVTWLQPASWTLRVRLIILSFVYYSSSYR